SVDDGETSLNQYVGGPVDRLFERGRLAFNSRNRTLFHMMIQKPRFSEYTGVFGLGNRRTFDRQLHVITNAPAEGAGCVLDHFERGIWTGSRFGRDAHLAPHSN